MYAWKDWKGDNTLKISTLYSEQASEQRPLHDFECRTKHYNMDQCKKKNPEAFTVTKQAVEVELMIQDPATHCNHSNSFLFSVHNKALDLFLSLYS
jgi:hypothetical protein